MPTLLQNWLKHHEDYRAAGRKLAIISGGGGNAGVHNAAILAALTKTSTFPPNATYVGISVGAYGLLYTLINQEWYAPTIFGRFYCDYRFFNPWRLLTRRPSLSLDYVLNEVTEHIVPIDYANAEKSLHKIFALTTSDNGEPTLLPLTNTSKSEVKKALRATAAMPLIARTDKLDHMGGWDGWLIEHQLLAYLQTQGITDVVWFLNRPLEEPESFVSRHLSQHIIRKFRRHSPSMARLFVSRNSAGNFLNHPPQGMQLEVIQPTLSISPVERNSAKLFHALGTAYRHMAAYLGQPDLPYPAEWKPWQHHMPPKQALQRQNS